MSTFSAFNITRAATEEIEITAYGSVAILAAFIWDWILCIPGEVKFLHRMRLNAPIVAYYVSRVSSLGYCICVVLLKISIVPPSTQVEVSMQMEVPSTVFWWVASSATSLLFCFRICAVYNHSKAVRIVFSALWLFIITTPAVMFLNSHLNCSLSMRKYCGTWNPLSLPANGTIFINDTLVFLGVSRQIYKNAIINEPVTRKKRFKVLVTGEGLYKVSKSLLQGGQLYYGTTICFQVAGATTFFFGLPYSGLIGVSYVALSSALACKVFRMVLLCETDLDPLGTVDIESRLRAASADGRPA